MIREPPSPPVTPRPAPEPGALRRRALAIWPRLDRTALGRCGDDPTRIANLVARRTSIAPEEIRRILTNTGPTDDEVATWFG